MEKRPKKRPATGGMMRARVMPSSKIPKVIPPRSIVILRSFDSRTSPDWKQDLGRTFRVGYYNRKDGLNCIWLVNEKGEYEQTTDRQTLLKHFFIKLSTERDLFGEKRPPLRASAKPVGPALAEYIASVG
jgi:hypothetical protein